jgi:hypothetical protein
MKQEQEPKKREPRRPQAQWMQSPRGQFSKLSYAEKNSADGLEPYFVWADVSGFAQLRKPDEPLVSPEYLPILLQLAPDYKPSDLPLKEINASGKNILLLEPGYLQQSLDKAGGLVPGLAGPEFFSAMRSNSTLRKAVVRFELDVPQGRLPDVAWPGSTQTSNMRSASVQSKSRQTISSAASALSGTVIAFIDDGCPFAHAHFWTCSSMGKSKAHDLDLRIKRYWDMNERASTSPDSPPALFATELYPGENGREFTEAQLIQLMNRHVHNAQIDEDGIYAEMAQGTKNNINRMLKPWSHGAHVMDIACGPYRADERACTRTSAPAENPNWEAENDAASEAPVIFVQLPMRTVQDTTLRGTMQQDVIKALDYILDQCSQADEIIVNLSWGTLAGPHTGSNMLEREIDARIAANAGRLKVVIPAGNGRQSRTHAHFGLAISGDSQGRDSLTLNWRNQPDDNTESYLEIWMEDGVDLRIDITTPNGDVLAPVMPGDVKFLSYTGQATWPAAQPDVIFAAIYNQPALDAAQLGPGRGVMLALAPTHNLANTRKTAYHGIWKVKVTNLSNRVATIDGYIERDDDAADTRRGSRQSYFDDPAYDRFVSEDDALPATAGTDPSKTYVRREGVFNSIATGRETIKVAGVRLSDLKVAEYSPHHYYSGRPQRAGTLIAREMANGNTMLYAMSEESKTLPGVRAAGTRSGCSVRLAGTSLSAPQIARDLANGWAVADLLSPP